MSSPPDRRAHLRAVLLAAVVVGHGLAALPAPRKVSRAQFDHPVAVEELARWVGVLARVGVETTPEALEDGLVRWGGGVADVRRAALAPAKPLFRWTGTGQGWGLFAFPDSFPDALSVDGRGAGGTWTPLYVVHDSEHAWLAPQLRYRRTRGVYDGHTDRPGPPYENFAAWVGREALADHPELAAVRVSFLRSHTVAPPARPEPQATRRLVRIVHRGVR